MNTSKVEVEVKSRSEFLPKCRISQNRNDCHKFSNVKTLIRKLQCIHVIHSQIDCIPATLFCYVTFYFSLCSECGRIVTSYLQCRAVIPKVGRTPHRWARRKCCGDWRFFSSLPNFFFLTYLNRYKGIFAYY